MLYRLIGSAAATYALIVVALYIGQRHLLYLPDRSRPILGDLVSLGVREIELATADGLALLSWYLPPRRGRPVIVYFHGNGGHIGYRAQRLRQFARYGYGMLMPEYRGYGGNLGTPSEGGLYADGDAALDFLARDGVGPERLVLYGESLGTGVAVNLAARHAIAGLILEAAFTSVADVAQCHYPFVPASVLVRDRFDSMSWIAKVKAPVLVLHGDRDGIVPSRFGRALFDAAPDPKEGWFHPEAGHGDLVRFGALEAVVGFLERRVLDRVITGIPQRQP